MHAYMHAYSQTNKQEERKEQDFVNTKDTHYLELHSQALIENNVLHSHSFY
jgi:hypothetical protein